MGQEPVEFMCKNLTERIIGAAIEVHRALGSGLLESAYQHCLAYELRQIGLHIATEVPVALHYKGVALDCGYRADLIVEGQVLLELKSVEKLAPIHEAQLISYLKLTRLPVGLIINFNVRYLKDGVLRRALTFPLSAISALSAVNPSAQGT